MIKREEAEKLLRQRLLKQNEGIVAKALAEIEVRLRNHYDGNLTTFTFNWSEFGNGHETIKDMIKDKLREHGWNATWCHEHSEEDGFHPSRDFWVLKIT